MANIELNIGANMQELMAQLDAMKKQMSEFDAKVQGTFEKMEKEGTDAAKGLEKSMTESMVKSATSINKTTDSLEALYDQEKALEQLMSQTSMPDAQKQLQKEIDATKKKISELGGSAKQFRDITNMSLGEMRRYMKELRNISLVGMTPAQIKEVNTQIAQLTDAMADYRSMVKATGDKTEMLIETMQGFVGIAQGVTGTLALMGIENKNLEKSMLALINLSQAMATFHQMNERGLLSTYKATILKKVETIQLTIAEKAANATTKAGAVAWKFLGNAMKAVPFVAIVAGMTALAGLLIKNAFSTKEYEAAQARFNAVMSDSDPIVKEYNASLKAIQTEIDAISRKYRVLTGEITQTQADIEGIQQNYETNRELARSEHAKRLVQIDQETGRMIAAENKRWAKQQENAAATERQITESEERDHQQRLLNIKQQADEKRNKSKQLYNTMRIKLVDKMNLETEVQNQEEIDANASKWQQEYEAAQRFFKQIQDKSYGSMWETMKQYETDAKTYGEYLNKKLWSYNQYTEAMQILTGNYEKKMKEFEIVDEPEELFMPDFTPKMSAEMKAFWDKYFENMDEELGKSSDDFEPTFEDKLGKAINGALQKLGKKPITREGLKALIGLAQKMATELNNSFNQTIDDQIKKLDDFVNRRTQVIGELESLLAAEIQLNEQGYASNIQLYQQRIEREQELRDQAIIEREKYEKRKNAIETISQGVDMASAIASLLKDSIKSLGPVGVVVGAALITALLALFKKSKNAATQATKFAKGGKGILDGASHAAGGVNLGEIGEGEGGEAYYILNKRATAKHRPLMDAIFDAVNGGRINLPLEPQMAGGTLMVEMKEQDEIKKIWNHMKSSKSTVYGNGYRDESFGNVRRRIWTN